MISFIKRQIQAIKGITGKRILLENFVSLSVLQVVGCILPLITVPYLVRVLGPEKFGLIAFAQAFISYFMVLSDYGFNFSATKKISIHRDNKDKVSEIFSSVMLIKFCFSAISILIIGILVAAIPRFRNDWLIYILTFGTIIGNSLFPLWFFKGMENMKYITLLNILARTVFTISIFIFVKHQENYIYVPLLNSLGLISAGLLGLWFVRKHFNIRFIIPNINSIIEQLRDGWHIFISTIATSLYTVSTSFILGIFTNNTIVGYYSAGEKIILPLLHLKSSFGQTIFPRISKLASESKDKAIQVVCNLGFIMGLIILTSSLVIFLFAETITTIILGGQFYQSILIIKILAFCPFIIFINNILGTQIMIPFNLLSDRTKVLAASGLLNLVLLLILVPIYQHIGAAVSLITTEAFVTFGLFYYIVKRGLIEPLQFEIIESK